MPRIRLTALAVEKIMLPETGQIDYFDSAMPAFGVRVSKGGSKTFFVMTRVHSKLTRLSIGRVRPSRTAPGMTLKAAKEKAVEWLELAEQGLDPRQQVQLVKAENQAKSLNTFSVVAERFMSQHVEVRLAQATQREYRALLFGPDTARWRNYPVSEVTKAEVIALLDEVVARGSPSAANNTFAYLRKFFNWCAEKDLLEYPPTDRIKAPAPKVIGDRVLAEEELSYVWRAADELGGLFGDIVKLLMLTGQRRMEVGAMAWDEFKELHGENPVWEIPASRTKNKRPHVVPLAPKAVEIIRSRPEFGEAGLLFTTTGTTPYSGYGKNKKHLDDKINALRSAAGLAPMPPWRLHDLRRTMVTMMNEHLGIAPHVVEACVNHISGGAKAGIAGVYNKALYMEDRRRAYSGWEKYIDFKLMVDEGVKR